MKNFVPNAYTVNMHTLLIEKRGQYSTIYLAGKIKEIQIIFVF